MIAFGTIFRMIRAIIPSLSLLWVIATLSNTAAATVRFERFGIQDGLSDNTITAICRDSQGFMWFGTRNGLNRFDGYNYLCFTHDLNDSTSISDNFIDCIFEDSDGVLWIGTLNGGLNRYHRETKSFSRYLHDPADSLSLSNNTVNVIAEGRDGILWIGTINGLNAFNREKLSFSRYYHDPADSLSLNNSNAGCVFVDSKGAIWIGTNSGLNVMSPETKTIRRIADRNKATSGLNQNIIDIVEGENGVLWLSTWGGGLRKFDTKTESFEVFLHNPDNPNSLNSNVVGHMIVDNRGVLWFGTTMGLHSFDPHSNRINRYVNNSSDPNSLNSDAIWGLYYDKTGILWIGTLYGGGCKIVPSKSVFTFYDLETMSKGKYNSNYTSNFKCVEPWIWFTSSNGLHRIDLQHNTFESYSLSDISARGEPIEMLMTLFVDRDEQLWLGASLPGLIRFDDEKKTFTSYSPTSLFTELQHFNVQTIVQDKDGLLWLGTSIGILAFDPTSETFIRIGLDNKENLYLKGIADIMISDVDNYVWLTGDFGLYRWDREHKRMLFVFSNRPESAHLKNNYIYSALDDGYGTLWLGTGNGLYSYETASGNTTRHTLFNDSIHSVIQDNNGAIWASTNAGLSRIDRSSLAVKNFDAGDGLPFIDNVDKGMYCAKNGMIFVGGQNGFYTFHPDSIHTGSLPPPVVLTSLKIDSVEQNFDTTISELSEISLPYHKGTLTVEFSALDYASPSKNVYSYKLDGLNTDWIDAGNQRRAVYTNLEPGSYTFRVKAANSQGVWNEKGVSLHITIIPPFWKTIWFKILAVITFFGVVYIGYIVKVKNVLRRNRELERRVQERTEELRRNNEELQNQIAEREKAESKVKVLGGLIPICASCKQIRDDKGYWTQLESYIRDHSEADFSHSICPDCMKKLYPEYYASKDNKENSEEKK